MDRTGKNVWAGVSDINKSPLFSRLKIRSKDRKSKTADSLCEWIGIWMVFFDFIWFRGPKDLTIKSATARALTAARMTWGTFAYVYINNQRSWMVRTIMKECPVTFDRHVARQEEGFITYIQLQRLWGRSEIIGHGVTSHSHWVLFLAAQFHLYDATVESRYHTSIQVQVLQALVKVHGRGDWRKARFNQDCQCYEVGQMQYWSLEIDYDSHYGKLLATRRSIDCTRNSNIGQVSCRSLQVGI